MNIRCCGWNIIQAPFSVYVHDHGLIAITVQWGGGDKIDLPVCVCVRVACMSVYALVCLCLCVLAGVHICVCICLGLCASLCRGACVCLVCTCACVCGSPLHKLPAPSLLVHGSPGARCLHPSPQNAVLFLPLSYSNVSLAPSMPWGFMA